MVNLIISKFHISYLYTISIWAPILKTVMHDSKSSISHYALKAMQKIINRNLNFQYIIFKSIYKCNKLIDKNKIKFKTEQHIFKITVSEKYKI